MAAPSSARWIAMAAVAASAALLAVAPQASAATASVDAEGVVHYVAAPGEANDLTYGDGPYPVFRDAGAIITAGSGCSPLLPPESGVLCTTEGTHPDLSISLGDEDDMLTDELSDFDSVTVQAGDGADQIAVNPQFASVSGEGGNDVIRASGNSMTGLQSGGDGNDRITIFNNAQGSIEGGLGDDTLAGSTEISGGDGNDVITTDPLLDSSAHGGAGDDVLSGLDGADDLSGGSGDDLLDGGTGPDVFSGGPDSDVVSYLGRSESVTVAIDGAPTSGGAADGPAGARDLVGHDVEALWGGDGPDTLHGDDADNLLYGGGGADTILGLGGVDAVDYSDRTAGVTVRLDGTAGSGNADDGPAGARDRVGADIEDIFGGAGPDTLTGNAAANFIDGGAGNDEITTRDAGSDVAFCAAGIDRAVVDAADEVDPSCETTVLPAVTPSGRPPVTPPVVVPDGDAPSLDVALSRKRNRGRVLARGLVLRTRCSEPCRITGRLVVGGRQAKRLGLTKRRKPFIAARGKASAPGTLRLTFTARAQRRLKLARRLTLTLRIRATDRAGNVTTSVRRLTFRGKRVTLGADAATVRRAGRLATMRVASAGRRSAA